MVPLYMQNSLLTFYPPPEEEWLFYILLTYATFCNIYALLCDSRVPSALYFVNIKIHLLCKSYAYPILAAPVCRNSQNRWYCKENGFLL